MTLKYEVYHEGACILYYRHNKIHRLNGPAIIWKGSYVFYREYGLFPDRRI